MLLELDIKDFALIEHIHVNFLSGLNILTGETGAGKSIIIDALSCVLGAKAGATSIKSDAEKAVIEAIFEQSSEVSAWLKHNQLQNEDAEQLIISREISKSGSRLRINGSVVNSALLAELRQQLLSMHAQHEARTLLSSPMQLALLDGLGDDNHKKLANELRASYIHARELKEELASMQMSQEERLQRLDFARFQFNELKEANLSDVEEDEKLTNECQILENIAKIELETNSALTCLKGDDHQNDIAAIDLLQRAVSHTEHLQEFDSSLNSVCDALKNCVEIASESARTIRRYQEKLSVDPERLNEFQERLALLSNIKRKYGPSLSEAIARLESLDAEIQKLTNMQSNSDEIQHELTLIESKLKNQSTTLSKARHKLAKGLAEDIRIELSALGMEHCQFEIALEEVEISQNGSDHIEFLIAPNAGQPLLPLSKIASGGELSRVMLAIKSIFAQSDQVATVIFDEIDTGLSGKVLKAMRDRLTKLSKSHQVLCITHQPIIAASADNHILVSKKQTSQSTAVNITQLNENQRVKELAEMASGLTNKQEALDFAQALYNDGMRLKQS